MAGELEGRSETRDVRARILEAASRLIATGGLAALTTRAVASAASVQAPTLYRLFGDKRGLLSALAEHGQDAFFARKAAVPPHPDPVQNLSDAWDAYISFGIAHPAVFAITNEVGAPASGSPAMRAGIAILRERVERIAHAGRLRMPVERAVALIHAVGVGTVATLLAVPDGERDPGFPSVARDMVLAAISAAPSAQDETSLPTLAVGLRAHLDNAKVLTAGERLLLHELLSRLSKPIDTA